MTPQGIERYTAIGENTIFDNKAQTVIQTWVSLGHVHETQRSIRKILLLRRKPRLDTICNNHHQRCRRNKNMTKIETQKITLDDLTPAEYNPRVMKPSNQLKLKKGLETYGLVDPIIIDLTDNNTIIGGHQRYETLQQIDPEQTLHLLKLGDIGWVFTTTDLKIKDKNDQKSLNISLNNQNLMGDWDYLKLDILIEDLIQDNYQVELTGFTEEDLLFDEEDITQVDYEDTTPHEPNIPTPTTQKDEVVQKKIICPQCQHEILL